MSNDFINIIGWIPFLIIGNFIEGIIFIMIILPPTTRNVEFIIFTKSYIGRNKYYGLQSI